MTELTKIIIRLFEALLFSKMFGYLLLALVISHPISKIINNFKVLGNYSSSGRQSHVIYTEYGYDYVRSIFERLPDKSIVPSVRYKDFSRDVYLLFPEKHQITTKDILIAIDVATIDFMPQPISRLTLTQTDWQFSTLYDYDTLNGFGITIKHCNKGLESIRIRIYSNTYSKTEEMSETLNFICTTGFNMLSFNTPLRNFSFGRGATPFRVVLESDLSQENIDEIVAIGTKIDIGNYFEINKYKKNYTFISHAYFLENHLKLPYLNFIKQIIQLPND